MQKTILSLCSIVIAITLFFTSAVPVMADNGKNQELTQSNRTELIIRMADKVDVGQPVDITVFTIDKATSDNVSDVDIYAYKMKGFAASLGFTFRAAFSFGNTARQNLAMSVSDDGFHIGTTDESGILEYAFDEEGHYLLIAFKAGYSPDFERIEVISTESE